MKKEVFISRLKDARDPDEIRRILTESGYTPSEEAVNNIRELINAETETKCRDLSEDELSAVSGGATERDYATEGCAATVENDSHCFGTDGGCLIVNIDYIHSPMFQHCPRCGAQTMYRAIQDPGSDLRSIYACRTCGMREEGFDIFVAPYL